METPVVKTSISSAGSLSVQCLVPHLAASPCSPFRKRGKCLARKQRKRAGIAQRALRFCSRIRGSRQILKISMFLTTEKILFPSELFIRDSLYKGPLMAN